MARHCSYGGKVRFDTEAEARAVLEQLQASPDYAELRRAYRCHNCHGWHLTSEPLRFIVIPRAPRRGTTRRRRKW